MTPRLSRLARSLTNHDSADRDVDAILISNETNVRYLSGFTGDSSWLVVTADGSALILSDRRYETQLAIECPGLPTAVRPPGQLINDLLAEVLSQPSLGQVGRLGFEAAHVTVGKLRDWREKSPSIDWVETTGVVESLRSIKDEAEIATIRRSIEIAQRSFLSVTQKLTPHMTEIELAHELEATMRTLGASGVSFPPIVGAEPRGALPHYRPGHEPIGDARTLLIDWGARFDGYCSDLTRTLHQPGRTSPTSARFAAAYEAVLSAQEAAIAAIRHGSRAVDVDQAARDVLIAAGLGEAFKHGLGHSFGLEIHEDPRMGPASHDTLAAGMVVTVEPGVYFEGQFGIRIEDDVLVTADGCERLSDLPKGLDDCVLVL